MRDHRESKEAKNVEFGARCNNILVDVKKIGGDASYAGNTNREMCTSNAIELSERIAEL